MIHEIKIAFLRRTHFLLMTAVLFLLGAVSVSAASVDELERRALRAENEDDYAMAIAMYSQILRQWEKSPSQADAQKIADIFMRAYNLCSVQNRYIEGIDFAAAGFRAAEKADNKMLMARFIGNLGTMHSVFGDHASAISYFKRGYELSFKYGFTDLRYLFLVALCTDYIADGNIKKAKEVLNKIQTARPPSEREGRFYPLYLQGMVAEGEKAPRLARYYHRLALEEARKTGMPIGHRVNEIWKIGKTFIDENIPDSAEVYLECALDTALHAKEMIYVPRIYSSLSMLASLRGDTAEYEKYRTLYSESKEHVFSSSAFNRRRNSLVEYEEMVKDTTIRHLNDKVFVQWTVIAAIALILLITGVFFFLLMKRNRALRFSNTKLIDRNRELLRVEEENRRLMEEHAAHVSAQADLPHAGADARQDAKPFYLSEKQTGLLLARIRSVLYDPVFLFNPDFSLSVLAQETESNLKYVSWVINTTYSKSFKALLNDLRVQEASKRLEDDNYAKITIQAVAEEVGYKSATSFIIAFKKIVGMTPSVYQKLAREKQPPLDEDAS